MMKKETYADSRRKNLSAERTFAKAGEILSAMYDYMAKH